MHSPRDTRWTVSLNVEIIVQFLDRLQYDEWHDSRPLFVCQPLPVSITGMECDESTTPTEINLIRVHSRRTLTPHWITCLVDYVCDVSMFRDRKWNWIATIHKVDCNYKPLLESESPMNWQTYRNFYLFFSCDILHSKVCCPLLDFQDCFVNGALVAQSFVFCTLNWQTSILHNDNTRVNFSII